MSHFGFTRIFYNALTGVRGRLLQPLETLFMKDFFAGNNIVILGIHIFLKLEKKPFLCFVAH